MPRERPWRNGERGCTYQRVHVSVADRVPVSKEQPAFFQNFQQRPVNGCAAGCRAPDATSRTTASQFAATQFIRGRRIKIGGAPPTSGARAQEARQNEKRVGSTKAAQDAQPADRACMPGGRKPRKSVQVRIKKRKTKICKLKGRRQG